MLQQRGFRANPGLYSEGTRNRCRPFPDDLQLLSQTDGTDSGEAILYAMAARADGTILATGDKTSLRSLARSDACRRIADLIAGRVICFEQIILRIIATAGVELVKARVVPNMACDTVLRAMFGSGGVSVESNVHDGLQSYISEIRGLPIALLVP